MSPADCGARLPDFATQRKEEIAADDTVMAFRRKIN